MVGEISFITDKQNLKQHLPRQVLFLLAKEDIEHITNRKENFTKSTKTSCNFHFSLL